MPSDHPCRLLQVSPAFAAVPTSGAELRSYHLAAGLAQHMPVTHIGFTRSADCAAGQSGNIRFIPVPRPHGYRAADLARGALGPVPFPVLNYSRDNMRAALREVMAAVRFDIVQLESIHLAGYLPLLQQQTHRPRMLVCDWHNIESELLVQSARSQTSLPRKLYVQRQAALLERYERWFVQQCDAHIVCSEQDREALLRYAPRGPVLVIGNGVDTGYFAHVETPAGRASRRRVLFVGSMDYPPNIDAVTYFAAEVWPEIQRHLPDAVFTIVGRNPPDAVRSLEGRAGIEVTGSVPDVRPYYDEAFVAVVPLRMGGGTRLKILEAMAAGVPVVSTTLGAEGLAAGADVHYFRADTALAIATRVCEAACGQDTIAQVAAAGRELARRLYDWRTLAGTLTTQLLSLLNSGRSRAATTA